MKVLTVVRSLGLGGTERSAKNYAALYHEMGYNSAILSFTNDYVPVEWLDKCKLSIFHITKNQAPSQKKNAYVKNYIYQKTVSF